MFFPQNESCKTILGKQCSNYAKFRESSVSKLQQKKLTALPKKFEFEMEVAFLCLLALLKGLLYSFQQIPDVLKYGDIC